MRNVAIDVETTKLPTIHPWQDNAYLVCLSTADEQGNTRTWFFNHPAATKTPRECIQEIQEYLNQFSRIIAHNLKFELHWLRRLGLDIEDHKLWCTMVVEYLIRGHQKLQGLSLDALGKHYDIPLKKDKVKVYWDADKETDEVPAGILSVYCEQDALNAMLIFKHQTKKVKPILKILSLEMEVIRCYQEMEYNGMQVSEHKLARYSKIAGVKLQRMEDELKELLGIPEITNQWLSRGLFGGPYTVDKQVPVHDEYGQTIRFKSGIRKGEVKTKKIQVDQHHAGIGFNPKEAGIPETAAPGIYSVSKETLPTLKAKTNEQARVLEILTEYSKLSKLKSGYYDSLPQLAVNGRVHGSVNQALTRTGRTSCARPNLQNAPRGNNGDVKKCFVSRF